MTNYLQTYGRMLLASGYIVVPIKQGSKRPANGEDWQNSRLTAEDLDHYPGCGVGIICGQGAHPIAAVDIDVLEPSLVDQFASWCRLNLGVTVERVGNTPKLMLVYRGAEQGFSKATGAYFTNAAGIKQRVEVLGKGQQFVAYHIHPDTNEPYEWVDVLGGLESMRADELTSITSNQIAEALRVFEDMAIAHGLKPVKGSKTNAGKYTARTEEDNFLLDYEPPIGLSLEDVKKRLEHVDNEDYDTWLKVGMSLHHEFEGSDEALALWDEWSSSAVNYSSSEEIAYKWATFGANSGRTVTCKWLIKESNVNKRDALKAEKRDALEVGRERIINCHDSIDLVNEIAHEVGAAAGNDIAVKAELAALLKARFKALTGATLTAVEVRNALQGGKKLIPKARGPAKRERTEFGNAERMLDAYGRGLMYVPALGGWFIWTGIYWKQASNVAMEHLAKETIKALPDELKSIDSDTERAEFFKHCGISQKSAMVGSMLMIARSDPRVVVGDDQLDANNWLLGAANGTIDLRTGELLPPDQNHRITVITSTEYDTDAKCPVFEKTILDVFSGSVEMVEFFQRLVGYSLLGKPDEDLLILPYGTGSNGKSTIIGAIRDALGGHARTAPSETFLASGPGSAANAGGARPDIIRLRGARFVYVTEPDEGSELREGLVKSMTGGESIAARVMYSNAYVEIKPTWSIFMPTNHKPIIKGSDYAIWRRLLPVPFNRNFDKDKSIKKDSNRAEKLARELEGILRWCIKGAVSYLDIGLEIPQEVSNAREEYKAEMDLLAEWLDECCELGYFECSSSDLWESWEYWAKRNGMHLYIKSKTMLTRRLVSKFETKNGNAKKLYFLGIRVKNAEDLA